MWTAALPISSEAPKRRRLPSSPLSLFNIKIPKINNNTVPQIAPQQGKGRNWPRSGTGNGAPHGNHSSFVEGEGTMVIWPGSDHVRAGAENPTARGGVGSPSAAGHRCRRGESGDRRPFPPPPIPIPDPPVDARRVSFQLDFHLRGHSWRNRQFLVALLLVGARRRTLPRSRIW